MDNKITKKRLSDFIAYEWVAIIVAFAIIVAGWEVFYALFSVRLTPGQKFKYFIDYNVSISNSVEFHEVSTSNFSYDVLDTGSEWLSQAGFSDSFSVLEDRLRSYDGDVIITDSLPVDKPLEKLNVRSKALIDIYNVYSLNKLLSDARTYVRDNFFLDAYKNQSIETIDFTQDKIDDDKVAEVFLNRQKGDNRFRTAEQKNSGVQFEKQRIVQLCKEITDFAKFMEYANTQQPELLYRYTRFEQSVEVATNENNEAEKAQAEQNYQNELNHRPNEPYGINLEYLTSGTVNPSRYFKVVEKNDAKNLVLMAFDFRILQPHLQYETLSFINSVIREFSSGIID